MGGLTTAQINEISNTTVVIHPLVLLSVVDHASRVPTSSKKRILGILLGQNDGKTINVANSFAVPFEEDDKDPKTWFLDLDYIESMWEMFRKVNAKERPIGFYHTGPQLRSSDLDISERLKRFMPRPVMVIVDVRPSGGRGDVGIPTDAYFAVEEIKDDGTATQRSFAHIPSSIEAEEAEEIGVEHLLRDIKSPHQFGTLSTRVSSQLASLKGLHSRLIEIRDYLALVAKGKLPVNHQIMYNLQDVFNLLPDLDGQANEARVKRRAFRAETNDQLMVVFLSSLVRSVLALHDLIENRTQNSRAELEDAKTAEQQAIEAAAEKAGVDAKDVEKGRKEREEEEKGEKGKKK
ncbi:hypothetical protein QFC20_003344 [Naganishia adeliensis]|uniref:Uncharacterized protein n=1 Tax=Naganishia adeliensis TaxID=92952 RepID=A0ACC2WC04_9TREE|nr:hypothetical protein QFC20_003344 [Naganishia adeliensis]